MCDVTPKKTGIACYSPIYCIRYNILLLYNKRQANKLVNQRFLCGPPHQEDVIFYVEFTTRSMKGLLSIINYTFIYYSVAKEQHDARTTGYNRYLIIHNYIILHSIGTSCSATYILV